GDRPGPGLAGAVLGLAPKMLDEKGDVIAPLAQRWDPHRYDVQPEEEIFAEVPTLTCSARSVWVEAMQRTSTCRLTTPPSGRIPPDTKPRRRRASTGSGMSPTSSRNRVPPSASAKRPLRAPGKAPPTWPKSSLSSSPSGETAQLTATKGPSRRSLS